MKAILIIALFSLSLCSGVDTVVQCAKEQLGKPYLWGGKGPDNFDCSGLVKYCYEKAGIELPHKASSQAGYGKTVTSYEPGDLLFFGNSVDTIHHVAIYVGNKKYIEAPGKGKSVKYTSVGRKVILAKRIL